MTRREHFFYYSLAVQYVNHLWTLFAKRCGKWLSHLSQSYFRPSVRQSVSPPFHINKANFLGQMCWSVILRNFYWNFITHSERTNVTYTLHVTGLYNNHRRVFSVKYEQKSKKEYNQNMSSFVRHVKERHKGRIRAILHLKWQIPKKKKIYIPYRTIYERSTSRIVCWSLRH